MQRIKLSLVAAFTIIAAAAAMITFTAPPLQARSGLCGNTACDPGMTSCYYHWNSICTLSGTPPHYCSGWSTCEEPGN
jgi:hypothetical protein